MITRRIAINLAAFLIVAVLLVLYGVVDLFGNPLEHHRKAIATFPSAGGLHPHFQVSLNGVPVGEITSIKLEGTGVKVSMSFDKGTKVPADVQARIIRSSAVGEQRIDLTPMHGGTEPRLADGATIPVAKTDPVPPDVGEVLTEVNDLIKQIPAGDLNKVVHEAAEGLAGRSSEMRSIVDSLTTLSHAYLQHQDAFRQLLVTSPTLLEGLASSAASLQSGLQRTKSLTELLKSRRFDLVNLLENLTALGTIGNDFVLTNRANLTCILSDLADTTQFLQGANLHNLSVGLQLNEQFFGLVDKISPKGYAKDLGLGAPTRNDQTWLRVRTILPPPQPPASSYANKLPVPPTKPGAACRNVYGNGVGPSTQGATYTPLYGAELIAPTAADAEAPKAALTGPAGTTGHGSAAALGRTSTSAANPTSGVTDVVLVILGIVSLGLLLFAVPYARYRWRD